MQDRVSHVYQKGGACQRRSTALWQQSTSRLLTVTVAIERSPPQMVRVRAFQRVTYPSEGWNEQNPLQNLARRTTQQCLRKNTLGVTISKTASGTWTERVQVHSKMFDEFVTSVFPSTAQTPIHSQSASSDRASTVFKVPMGSAIDGSKGPNTMPSSKPSVDQEHKKIQRESSFPSERKVSSSGRERSTIPISKDGSDGRSLHQIRLPLGTRSENVSSYSNNLNQSSNVFKACKIDKQKEAHLEHVEDLQQKQVCSYPLIMLLHETICW